MQLSNDRFLRVREEQPGHIHSGFSERTLVSSHVITGDLCAFKRVDSHKVLLGRVGKFSYKEGNKKERAH